VILRQDGNELDREDYAPGEAIILDIETFTRQ